MRAPRHQIGGPKLGIGLPRTPTQVAASSDPAPQSVQPAYGCNLRYCYDRCDLQHPNDDQQKNACYERCGLSCSPT